jgi:hypothetical protein
VSVPPCEYRSSTFCSPFRRIKGQTVGYRGHYFRSPPLRFLRALNETVTSAIPVITVTPPLRPAYEVRSKSLRTCSSSVERNKNTYTAVPALHLSISVPSTVVCSTRNALKIAQVKVETNALYIPREEIKPIKH